MLTLHTTVCQHRAMADSKDREGMCLAVEESGRLMRPIDGYYDIWKHNGLVNQI